MRHTTLRHTHTAFEEHTPTTSLWQKRQRNWTEKLNREIEQRTAAANQLEQTYKVYDFEIEKLVQWVGGWIVNVLGHTLCEPGSHWKEKVSQGILGRQTSMSVHRTVYCTRIHFEHNVHRQRARFARGRAHAPNCRRSLPMELLRLAECHGQYRQHTHTHLRLQC